MDPLRCRICCGELSSCDCVVGTCLAPGFLSCCNQGTFTTTMLGPLKDAPGSSQGFEASLSISPYLTPFTTDNGATFSFSTQAARHSARIRSCVGARHAMRSTTRRVHRSTGASALLDASSSSRRGIGIARTTPGAPPASCAVGVAPPSARTTPGAPPAGCAVVVPSTARTIGFAPPASCAVVASSARTKGFAPPASCAMAAPSLCSHKLIRPPPPQHTSHSWMRPCGALVAMLVTSHPQLGGCCQLPLYLAGLSICAVGLSSLVHLALTQSELHGHATWALLLYFEEAIAGHIAFLTARGAIWSPAYVIWRRGGNLESSLHCLGPAACGGSPKR
jgi:hypothetical protein